MKKTLIAMAALAAASAFAQSSATLCGSVDAYFGQTSTTAPTPGATVLNKSSVTPFVKNKQTVVNSGGLGASRLGISVKEDLGNDMSAFVTIENELQTDAGTTGAAARTSVVGLGTSFGKLSIGRQATPLKDSSVRLADAQADSAFSAFNRAAAVSITTDRSPFVQRINNSVRYDTPDMNGFRGAVAIGTAQVNEAAPGKDKIFSMSLGYVVPGSWAIGFSHQSERNGQNTNAVPPFPGANGVTAGSNKVTINYLSGAVGTPVGKITLGFGGGKVSGVTGSDKGWNIGWSAPVGAWTFIAQYASFKADGQLGNLYNTVNTYRVTPANPAWRSGGARRSSFGVEAHYALSKRTTLYTGYNRTKNLAGIQDAKSDVLGLGMRHDF